MSSIDSSSLPHVLPYSWTLRLLPPLYLCLFAFLCRCSFFFFFSSYNHAVLHLLIIFVNTNFPILGSWLSDDDGDVDASSVVLILDSLASSSLSSMAPLKRQTPPSWFYGLALYWRDPQALHSEPQFLLFQKAKTVITYIHTYIHVYIYIHERDRKRVVLLLMCRYYLYVGTGIYLRPTYWDARVWWFQAQKQQELF